MKTTTGRAACAVNSTLNTQFTDADRNRTTCGENIALRISNDTISAVMVHNSKARMALKSQSRRLGYTRNGEYHASFSYRARRLQMSILAVGILLAATTTVGQSRRSRDGCRRHPLPPAFITRGIPLRTRGTSASLRHHHEKQHRVKTCSRQSRRATNNGGRRVTGPATMCGVIGILLADRDAQVSQELYDGLTILQHRGQDAAGIATSDSRKLHLHKNKGLARDVFGVEHMAALRGSYGVGHVRYPTSGCNSVEEAQPFRNNVPVGFCVTHNGHFSNGQLLRDQLSATRHFNTDSDTELMSELFGMELAARTPAFGSDLSPDLLFEVVQSVMSRCRGGYAVTVLINGYGILAFRDPYGVRPLCLGARPGGSGLDGRKNSGEILVGAGAGGGIDGRGGGGGWGKMDLAVASESAALTGLGFALRRDVHAGEAVFLDVRSGAVSSRVCAPNLPRRRFDEGAGEGKEDEEIEEQSVPFKPCLFEYVYMARPDSILDGVPVYEARKAMGLRLAKKIAREILPIGEVDVVVPVPETSRIAAMHCAASLNVPFEEGLTKNRYVGRTFIMPGQAFRRQNVRKKLSAVSCVLKGRSVLLVDDSIVRGTTSREIVRIVREAGAQKVYFCSASPPVRHPNCYGIDLPRQCELLAFGLTESEIAEAIGADGVVFQDLSDLEESVSGIRPGTFSHGFENSMFTGDYLASSDALEGDPVGLSISGGGSARGDGMDREGSRGDIGGGGGAVMDVI